MCRGSCDLAVGVGAVYYLSVAVGVVDGWLVDIDEIPGASTELTALELAGRLSEDNAEGVLAKGLVVGQRVVDLPGVVVTFIRGGRGVVGIVVTGEVEFLYCGGIVAPEGELGTVGEVILQVVEELQVEGELRHDLMRPVACGMSLHHGDWVVLLLIRTEISGHGIRIAVGILVEVVGTVLFLHGCCDIRIGDGDGQDR